MARPKTNVTKAALADILGLSAGRVSQLITKGLPVRPDGKVSIAAATKWYRDNVRDGPRKRGPKPKVALVAAPTQHHPRQPEEPPERLQCVLDTLRTVTAPTEILGFAKVALKLGCSLEQAYGLALWHMCAPCLAVDEIDGDDLGDFKEPTDIDWLRILGEKFNFAAADAAYEAATRDETLPPAA